MVSAMSEIQLLKDFGNKTHQIVKNTLKKAEEYRKELKKDRQNLTNLILNYVQ